MLSLRGFLDSVSVLVQQCLITLYLRSGTGLKINSCLKSAVPLHDPFEGFAQSNQWVPTQASPRLGGIQLEKMSLGGGAIRHRGSTTHHSPRTSPIRLLSKTRAWPPFRQDQSSSHSRNATHRPRVARRA